MAENITIDVPHQLGRDAARARIEGGFSKVGDALGSGVTIDQSWAGDTMTFAARAMGQAIDGHLSVHDDTVHIEVQLPWLLAKLAGPLKEKLEANTRTLLLEKK